MFLITQMLANLLSMVLACLWSQLCVSLKDTSACGVAEDWTAWLVISGQPALTIEPSSINDITKMP